jgi:hypothetical protein
VSMPAGRARSCKTVQSHDEHGMVSCSAAERRPNDTRSPACHQVCREAGKVTMRISVGGVELKASLVARSASSSRPPPLER